MRMLLTKKKSFWTLLALDWNVFQYFLIGRAWFTESKLWLLLAPNIVYHLPPLSATSRLLIHIAHSTNHMPAQTRPQSLTAECNLPSFCIKFSRRILFQGFQSFPHISEHRLVYDGHCRESTTFCRKRQFRLLLSVGCVLQLAPASSYSSWHYACVSKIRKSLCTFRHGAVH